MADFEVASTTELLGATKKQSDESKSTKGPEAVKVFIAGGGPAGLLAAHYLLAYGDGKFHVRLYDKGEDPCEVAARAFDAKRYSMNIAPRGYKSMTAVEGLREAVDNVLTPITAVAVNTGRKFMKLKVDPKDNLALVDRMNLCAALLGELRRRHADSELLDVRYNVACAPDLRNRTVSVTPASSAPPGEVEGQRKGDAANGGGSTFDYDLLIGADGVRSKVRHAMVEHQLSFHVEQRDIFNHWLNFTLPRPQDLDLTCMHIVPNIPGTDGVGAICVSADAENLCFIMGWPPSREPHDFLSLKSPEEVKAFFDTNLPWLQMPSEVAWETVMQRKRTTLMVKCGTYHDTEGSAVLIGDAAHATSPAIGNGCNASLVDAAVLARLLLGERVGEKNRIPEKPPQQTPLGSVAEIKARIPEALHLFSALQVREGHALVDLSWAATALDPRIAGWETLKVITWTMLTRAIPILKRFLRAPIQKMLVDGMPYNEILAAHSGSVRKIIAAYNKIRDDWLAKCDVDYVANHS